VREPALTRVLLSTLACLALFGACAGGQAPPSARASSLTLTVFAASSLTAALGQAETLYEAAHPGTALTISTDSSAALETKIEQGAPADLFLSADTSNPKKLVDRGFAAGAAKPFAANVLTIIVPAGNPAHVSSPFDLSRSGVKVIAAGDTVPITKYATLLVQNLAKLPGAPTGFEAAYDANVVTKVENVAAVVSQIELGQGDAAIVYVTDAKASGKVGTVSITPDSANVVATYAGVVVSASPQHAAAQAFLDWLAGPDGQAVLGTYGFLPPPR